jgi:AhpD family alkylhydroperoxidase
MRVDYYEVHPAAMRAMLGLEHAVHAGPLEPSLLELVKVRASQLNGCAHCVEMHTKDARAGGESDDRLHLVAVWREAPVFSERERAVFSDEELVALTLAIVAINGWNRFAVGFRAPVGNYVPRSEQPRPGPGRP